MNIKAAFYTTLIFTAIFSWIFAMPCFGFYWFPNAEYVVLLFGWFLANMSIGIITYLIAGLVAIFMIVYEKFDN